MAKPQLKTAKEWLFYLLSGLCIGSADLVPGISGGTMAFILGFYEELIANIKNIDGRALYLLASGQFAKLSEKISWRFLAALTTGIVVALATLSGLISHLLNGETSRIYLYSAFLGLILASALFCAKKVERWNRQALFALAAGGLAAYLLTTLPPLKSDNGSGATYDVALKAPFPGKEIAANYDKERKMLLGVTPSALEGMVAKGYIAKGDEVVDRATGRSGVVGDLVAHAGRPLFLPWIIFSGAIAISAMLLPGISGSYLLTILGSYTLVIGAVADLSAAARGLSFDGDAAILLGNFLIGIAIGAALFSRAISWLFDHYHNSTIALLVGFMLGALRSVWPFWEIEYRLIPLKLSKGPQIVALSPLSPDPTNELFWLALLAALLAFSLVIAIEFLALRKGRVDGREKGLRREEE